ncbi:hypothetical protein [Mycobacterium sherrisii]|uniref:Lipoprotein LpqS n=1 Tax=Mycobacterium sherrisii TaxID=243061 RepID=A0A1E3T6H7_9MYCO|nr:hypothetical protein [Mycobacterium sherrisii]MCV7030742.1 hypothetical protein [Mycobacterium sherrisii]MEC4764157.1 hypothetical protein [Mycobacterium sherrisii]ODR10066.1 hypothetical protein BHQ21_02895 [Mycobacterium sherrisii]ORW77178.1 hypothetical protein AWC25_09130 [Mycobacterium sherrisii]
MRPITARTNKWLRYATAVAALFWALGAAAGCHLPHLAMPLLHAPTMSAAAAHHAVSAAVQHPPIGGQQCSPMDLDCQHVAQSCTTTDLVALAVAVTLMALAASLAWPVVSTPRGPPRRAGFVPPRPGRLILTRHCIARI